MEEDEIFARGKILGKCCETLSESMEIIIVAFTRIFEFFNIDVKYKFQSG